MTGDISPQLLTLHDFLISEAVSEDAMLLGELDGFLAGVIVCPELIRPGEWLPLIWGEAPPAFADDAQAQQIHDLILGHYNDIIAQLNKGRYEPIFECDIDESALWEIWIEGFARAMDLRPGCMVGLAERHRDNEDIQRAVFVFGRLCYLVLDPHRAQVLDIDAELEEHAPDLIASHAEILHEARLAEAAASRGTQPLLQPKIGRNDPCPCGSGKKFKKCCLN
ncbi:MAG: UPF0149 family protein [Anderseniella sp.]|jgi:uncharacterized protein|nr:UPF0149 family protein [Anderseniella sp.]